MLSFSRQEFLVDYLITGKLLHPFVGLECSLAIWLDVI